MTMAETTQPLDMALKDSTLDQDTDLTKTNLIRLNNYQPHFEPVAVVQEALSISSGTPTHLSYKYVAYMTFIRSGLYTIPFHFTITSVKPPFKVRLFALDSTSPFLQNMNASDKIMNTELVPDFTTDPKSLKVDCFIKDEADWIDTLKSYIFCISWGGCDEDCDSDCNDCSEPKIACVDEDTYEYLSFGIAGVDCPIGDIFIHWKEAEIDALQKGNREKLFNKSIADRVVSSIVWQPYMQALIDEHTKDDDDDMNLDVFDDKY